MSQQALFHESLTDAIRELVLALGGTKKCGPMLRPEMAADHASRWLSDCMNEDRRERLSPDQLLFLLRAGRQAGVHVLMGYLCEESGYSPPQPVEPRDEIAELQRQYIEAAKSMKAIAERMERVNLKAVA